MWPGAPFVLMMTTPVGEMVHDWAPNSVERLAEVGVVALAVALIGALARTRGAVVLQALGGMAAGFPLMVGLMGLALVAMSIVVVVSIVAVFFDRWPGGLWCGLGGLILGSGLGAAHGYWSTVFTSVAMKLDDE
jgi:hypothetical protein